MVEAHASRCNVNDFWIVANQPDGDYLSENEDRFPTMDFVTNFQGQNACRKESVRDAIRYEYYLASSSGWTKGTSPVLWAEIRESSLIGPELVLGMTDKVVLIKGSSKAMRESVKIAMLDFRRISPLKLRSVLGNSNLHVPLNEIKIDKTLRFVEEPVEILDPLRFTECLIMERNGVLHCNATSNRLVILLSKRFYVEMYNVGIKRSDMNLNCELSQGEHNLRVSMDCLVDGYCGPSGQDGYFRGVSMSRAKGGKHRGNHVEDVEVRKSG
ncbi:hypothetical protein Tco_1473555 [Tanacetum coccineum]